MVQIGCSPVVKSSSKRIVYRQSCWGVHEWEAEGVCRMAAVRAAGSVLVWLGAGAPALGGAALAVPGAGCTALLAGPAPAPDAAAALARRLAARLARPVHACGGAGLDRLTLPLAERALVAQIQRRPDWFS